VTGPRDWDKELAAVDRAIERAPLSPSAPTRTAVALTPLRGSAARAWARLALVVALGAALPFWPYARGCGVGLLLYLGAVAVLLAAGTWAATHAWRYRRAAAHVLALAAIGWGAGLAAREVLPRIGYARVTATWACG
jgi:hypothetical protein